MASREGWAPLGFWAATRPSSPLLTVDNVNFYYDFKPKGEHEYTSIGFKLTISMSFVYSVFS